MNDSPTNADAYLSKLIPTYVKSMTGEYIDANEKFLELFGFENLNELKIQNEADRLMCEPVDRHSWLSSIYETGKADMVAKFRRKGAGEFFWARDMSIRVSGSKALALEKTDSEPLSNLEFTSLVTGCLVDCTATIELQKSLENQVKAMDSVANSTVSGVVKLDSKRRIIFANSFLLNRNPKIREFVKEQRSFLHLLTEKISSDLLLVNRTLDGLETQASQRGSDEHSILSSTEIAVTLQLPDSLPQPVSIQFFSVANAGSTETDGSPHTICTIRDLSLPNAILSFFKEYGPRHTLLSDIGVKTIIKQYKDDTLANRFIWCNDAFLKERNMSFQEAVSGGDREFFKDDCYDYISRDLLTLNRKETTQVIEKHDFLQSDGTSRPDYVFVVKMPAISNDELHVFYWDFPNGRFESIRDKLLNHIGGMYKRILDLVPFPVFSRDRINRFAYVNLAYTRHLSLERQDIIGRTDEELFSKNPKLVDGYAKVDDMCRNLPKTEKDRSITVEEENVGSDGSSFPVVTTKTAYSIGMDSEWIFDNSPDQGIQGILWGKNDIRDRITLGKSVLRRGSMVKPFCDIFVSYAKEDFAYLDGELMPHLKQLPNTEVWWDKEIHKTSDKWKDTIEKAVEDCQIAILLLSHHYFDADGYAKHEAELLLSRSRVHGSKFTLIPLKISPFADLQKTDNLQMQLSKYTDPVRNWKGDAASKSIKELDVVNGERDIFYAWFVEELLKGFLDANRRQHRESER